MGNMTALEDTMVGGWFHRSRGRGFVGGAGDRGRGGKEPDISHMLCVESRRDIRRLLPLGC